MDAIVRDCWFVSINACEATALAPEEQVIVDREKCVRTDMKVRITENPIVVCYQCCDAGWDEVEAYVVPDTSPDPYDDQMPDESRCYPLDR